MKENQYKNTLEADIFLSHSAARENVGPPPRDIWFQQVVILASRGNDYRTNADADSQGALYRLHDTPLCSWGDIQRLFEGLRQTLRIEGLDEDLKRYRFSIAITTREGVELVLLNDVAFKYVASAIRGAENWQQFNLAAFDPEAKAEWQERESTLDTMVQGLSRDIPKELYEPFYKAWFEISGYLCDKYRFDA